MHGMMSSEESDPLTWFVIFVTDLIWPKPQVDNELLQVGGSGGGVTLHPSHFFSFFNFWYSI